MPGANLESALAPTRGAHPQEPRAQRGADVSGGRRARRLQRTRRAERGVRVQECARLRSRRDGEHDLAHARGERVGATLRNRQASRAKTHPGEIAKTGFDGECAQRAARDGRADDVRNTARLGATRRILDARDGGDATRQAKSRAGARERKNVLARACGVRYRWLRRTQRRTVRTHPCRTGREARNVAQVERVAVQPTTVAGGLDDAALDASGARGRGHVEGGTAP